MPNPKRVRKTREQIKKELNNKAEVARKRTIIVDNFYPALIKATVSVDESKMLIQAMGSLIMEQVLSTMKQRSFKDIKDILIETLCPNGERKEEITALISTLEEENLYVAREIVEGMTRAIDTMVAKELQGRTLDTLKADWESYLN